MCASKALEHKKDLDFSKVNMFLFLSWGGIFLILQYKMKQNETRSTVPASKKGKIKEVAY
jgi:hypothetical protein